MCEVLEKRENKPHFLEFLFTIFPSNHGKHDDITSSSASFILF